MLIMGTRRPDSDAAMIPLLYIDYVADISQMHMRAIYTVDMSFTLRQLIWSPDWHPDETGPKPVSQRGRMEPVASADGLRLVGRAEGWGGRTRGRRGCVDGAESDGARAVARRRGRDAVGGHA